MQLRMSIVAATFNLEVQSYIVEVAILNRVSSGTLRGGGQPVCRVRTPFCRSPFGGRAYAAGRKFVRPCSIIFNPERAGLQNSLTRLVSQGNPIFSASFTEGRIEFIDWIQRRDARCDQISRRFHSNVLKEGSQLFLKMRRYI